MNNKMVDISNTKLITELDLWKFVYKESCRRYIGNWMPNEDFKKLKRRFNYFWKNLNYSKKYLNDAFCEVNDE